MPLHPRFAEHLYLLRGLPELRHLDVSDAAELQSRIAEYQTLTSPDAPAQVPCRMTSAPGPHGAIAMRVYDMESSGQERPCLVWIHGGAFRYGSIEMPEADWVARELARRADAVIVTVDYRLVTDDVKYPIPHDDVVHAVTWVREHVSDLGVGAERISVGGASAGANLAAGATLELRDVADWVPATLMLVYAVTHPVVPGLSTPLTDQMNDVPPVLRLAASTSMVSEDYLGGPLNRADGYAFPALGILDSFGPTLIINAEYDDLRGSSQDFAAGLARAGVDVQQVTIRGAMHGFLDHSPTIPPVSQALDVMSRALATGLS